jgi:hypothetical protein
MADPDNHVCLSSRLGGKPRSGIPVGLLGLPLELAGRADRTHHHDAGRLDPIGVLARERCPTMGVPIARAATLPAGQEHVPRHRCNLRRITVSSQEAGRDMATWQAGPSGRERPPPPRPDLRGWGLAPGAPLANAPQSLSRALSRARARTRRDASRGYPTPLVISLTVGPGRRAPRSA